MILKRLWTLNATLRPTQAWVAFKVRRFWLNGARRRRGGIFKCDVCEVGLRDMQGSDEGYRSGKPTKAATREARLAAKLRQNLVRRKEKTRAAATAADQTTAPAMTKASVRPGDNDQGD
jgi:hypothetical protein